MDSFPKQMHARCVKLVNRRNVQRKEKSDMIFAHSEMFSYFFPLLHVSTLRLGALR